MKDQKEREAQKLIDDAQKEKDDDRKRREDRQRERSRNEPKVCTFP